MAGERSPIRIKYRAIRRQSLATDGFEE